MTAEFIERIPGVPLDLDKDLMLKRLEPMHRAMVEKGGYQWGQLKRAEQTHGCGVAVVDRESPSLCLEVDALVTNDSEVLLGICVADCGAIYLVDRGSNAIGLIHSGLKSTQLNITGKTVRKMEESFGTRPEDLVMVMAPCIRYPAYDTDFASMIEAQGKEAGVKEVNDCGLCTTSDLNRYYSYRIEKGMTGRMLALLGRK